MFHKINPKCLNRNFEGPKLNLSTSSSHSFSPNPAGIYLFKINNGNTRTMCEICSKATIKTPERRRTSF